MEEFEIINQLTPHKTSPSYQIFESVPCGRYRLSVQGSSGHYCTPREVLPPQYYVSMEVAIFNKNREWLRVPRSSTLRAFPRYAELRSHADGIGNPYCVFGYVPIDLINDLYLYLRKFE